MPWPKKLFLKLSLEFGSASKPGGGGSGPRAGESGPISCFWGTMLLYQKLSCEWETYTIKGILNSLVFASHCKIHELLSSQLYLNIFYTFKNYKTNRNSNRLYLWSSFPSKSSKLQNLSMFSGKSTPLKLKILSNKRIYGLQTRLMVADIGERAEHQKASSGNVKNNNYKKRPWGLEMWQLPRSWE